MIKILIKFGVIISLGFNLILVSPAVSANDYQIRISKKNKELILEKSGKVVKRYKISSGIGGKGLNVVRGVAKNQMAPIAF